MSGSRPPIPDGKRASSGNDPRPAHPGPARAGRCLLAGRSLALTALDIRAAGAARPSRPPRLLVLDLDGTCIDAGNRLQPRVREAVRGATVPVVMATGRMYRSALPWAIELGITGPLICYHGALVRDLPGNDGAPGRVQSQDLVGGEVALAALGVARAHSWHFQAFQDDLQLCEHDRPEGRGYAAKSGVSMTLVPDLAPLLPRGSTKVMCIIDEPGDVRRCLTAFAELVGDSARVTQGLANHVEITSSRATKGRAVGRVCSILGIDATDVVAAGDAPNDVDLLEAAGFAVAIEPGFPALLARAHALCAPPERSGVADLIEALGLTRQPGGSIYPGL